MKTPNIALLTTEELQEVLDCFSTERQKRIIKGAALNAGILSHDYSQQYYLTFVSSAVQSIATRLAGFDLEIKCFEQEHKKESKEQQWYLCFIGDVEVFDTKIKAANDEEFS